MVTVDVITAEVELVVVSDHVMRTSVTVGHTFTELPNIVTQDLRQLSFL